MQEFKVFWRGWGSLHLQQKCSKRNSSVLQEMVHIEVHRTWGAGDDLEALYKFISWFSFKLSLGQHHVTLFTNSSSANNLGLKFADSITSVNYYIHKAQLPFSLSIQEVCICFQVFVHIKHKHICPESYSGCVHLNSDPKHPSVVRVWLGRPQKLRVHWTSQSSGFVYY